MEKYSSHVKIFMVCESMDSLIDPIKSRCLIMRVPAFTADETVLGIKTVLQREGKHILDEKISRIANGSWGNLRIALLETEMFATLGW